MEQQILRHVEQTEFFKEIARREVSRLLAAGDVRQMLDDPQAFVDELVAAILANLGATSAMMAEEARQYAVTLGLAELSNKEVDDAEKKSRSAFIAIASEVLFTSLLAVDAQLQRAIDSGVAVETLNATLASAATRDALLIGFEATARSAAATYFQDMERGIVDAAVQATADGAPDDQPANFEWLAIDDGKTCDDQIENSCLPRHNAIMTLDEWDGLGRPGAAQLLCSLHAKAGKSFCRCVLAESGKTGSSEKINPISVTAAIQIAKERAALVYS
jgi:hypothetical protein